MRKLGILTFHETLNYGALLQAYALQKYISLHSSDLAEIIDYRCEAVYGREFPQSLAAAQGVKEKVKYLVGKRARKEKAEQFSSFIKKNMKLSNQRYYSSNIKNAANEYDKFIVGSDQIWNFNLTGDDDTYYLDFVEDKFKKTAYAASFGYYSVPKQYEEKTERFLSEFSKISVREKSGQAIIKNLCNMQAEKVLDPVFLLNKTEWENEFSADEKSLEQEDYILVYLPHDKNNVFSYAKQLAKKTKCKIKYINITYIPFLGVENYYSLSPSSFLAMIRHAKYVVTGSFHGVAFSINFNKEFYYENSSASGKLGSRVDNLVELLHLTNRKISHEINEITPIDYTVVNTLLEKERKKSIDFLNLLL